MNRSQPGSPFLDAEFAGVPFEQVMAAPKSGAAARPGAGTLLRVLDRAGQRLAGRRWQVVQGRARWAGTLDAGGEARLPAGAAGFDAALPFRVHVSGHACAIVSGAVLRHTDPGVEYGGSRLDWAQAGAASAAARAAFWQAHDALRRDEPAVLWQHDHVMRRPLVATAALVVLEAHPLRVTLGPLVRYTDERQSLLWLELATPALVRVLYGRAPKAQARPAAGDRPAATERRHACSVRVGGRHFAMLVLDGLAADTVYQYRLELEAQPAAGALPQREADFTDEVFPRQGATEVSFAETAFGGAAWCFLRTLPRQSTTLRFAHGSCRKWPGDRGDDPRHDPGPDALDALGQRWLEQQPLADWPRFFMHTGDQIYADDIGVTLGATLRRERRAATLPGPNPTGPQDVAAGAWAGRFQLRYATADTRPVDDGPRQAIERHLEPVRGAREQQGLGPPLNRALAAWRQQAAHDAALAALPEGRRQARYHVLNRLLWWIPARERDEPRVHKQRGLLSGPTYRLRTAKPQDVPLPHPAAGSTQGLHAADFAEYAALYVQAWSTPGARKALAHLPSYMIFDDHEVTDDWNASTGWLARLHTARDPLAMWPMTVTDALAAYWVYQGWGNLAPAQAARDPRARVLAEAGRDGRDALPELRRLIHREAVLPMAPGARSRRRLDWHFAVPTGGTPFLVVDLRTDRELHGKGGLSQARLDWLRSELLASRSAAAFIVLPVPYLMPDPMLFVFRHPQLVGWLAGAESTADFKLRKDLEHPADNEVWHQIKRLLAELQARHPTLKTLAIVSGDVHFSANLDGQLDGSTKAPRLLQLMSSGLRQAIGEDTRAKLISSYRGGYSVLAGSEGRDRHKGVTITLAGLKGPQQKLDNFVFRPSFALLSLTTLVQTVGAQRVAVPRIEQAHVTTAADGRLEDWRLMHLTHADGRALMTLKDPGPEVRNRPSPYPKATQGVGFVREADDAEADLEAAADDGAQEQVEIEAAEAPLDEASELVELESGPDGEGFAAPADDEADRHDVSEAHEVIETEAAPVEAGEADDESFDEEEPAWTSSPN